MGRVERHEPGETRVGLGAGGRNWRVRRSAAVRKPPELSPSKSHAPGNLWKSRPQRRPEVTSLGTLFHNNVTGCGRARLEGLGEEGRGRHLDLAKCALDYQSFYHLTKFHVAIVSNHHSLNFFNKMTPEKHCLFTDCVEQVCLF